MGLTIGPNNAAAIVAFPAACVCVYALRDSVCERDGQQLQVLNRGGGQARARD